MMLTNRHMVVTLRNASFLSGSRARDGSHKAVGALSRGVRLHGDCLVRSTHSVGPNATYFPRQLSASTALGGGCMRGCVHGVSGRSGCYRGCYQSVRRETAIPRRRHPAWRGVAFARLHLRANHHDQQADDSRWPGTGRDPGQRRLVRLESERLLTGSRRTSCRHSAMAAA